MERIALTGLIIALYGCAAAPVNLEPGAPLVNVAHNPPANGTATFLGAIVAEHGHGCGGFGKVGNIEGAMNALRNLAVEQRANYVEITQMIQPGHTLGGFGCYRDKYTIKGNAYLVEESQATR